MQHVPSRRRNPQPTRADGGPRLNTAPLAHHRAVHRVLVAGDVVLRGGDARDHIRRGVLDLHLVQQDVAVLFFFFF